MKNIECSFTLSELNFSKKVGSPHAHLLLWLDNAPKNVIEEGMGGAVKLIDYLITVSESESSGNSKLQINKHTCITKKWIK